MRDDDVINFSRVKCLTKVAESSLTTLLVSLKPCLKLKQNIDCTVSLNSFWKYFDIFEIEASKAVVNVCFV